MSEPSTGAPLWEPKLPGLLPHRLPYKRKIIGSQLPLRGKYMLVPWRVCFFFMSWESSKVTDIFQIDELLIDWYVFRSAIHGKCIRKVLSSILATSSEISTQISDPQSKFMHATLSRSEGLCTLFLFSYSDWVCFLEQTTWNKTRHEDNDLRVLMAQKFMVNLRLIAPCFLARSNMSCLTKPKSKPILCCKKFP